MKERDSLLRKCRSVNEANVHIQGERHKHKLKMTSENSALIREMNELREEKKQYERKVRELENKLMQMTAEENHRSKMLTEESSSLGGSMQRSHSTPFLRREQNVKEETYRVRRRQAANQLPPAPVHDRKPRRAAASSVDKQLKAMTAARGRDRDWESQGFRVRQLEDDVSTIVSAGKHVIGTGAGESHLPLVGQQSLATVTTASGMAEDSRQAPDGFFASIDEEPSI